MNQGAGMAQGGIRGVLRLEGLAVLLGALWLYAETAHSWWTFAALLLVPDVALLFYLAGPRVGALAYNSLHSYVGPFALALVSRGEGAGFALALVRIAHCGMDSAFGFGLKYASTFGHTHLGPIGRSSTAWSTG